MGAVTRRTYKIVASNPEVEGHSNDLRIDDRIILK